MSKAKLGMSLRFVSLWMTDVLNPLFVMSLALFVSVGYILTLLLPMRIDHWAAVLGVCTLIPLVWLAAGAYAKWRRGVYVKSQAAWRMLLPLLPMLILAPPIWAEFAHPTMQILHHGNIHVGYIHQLLYGAAPPENVFVAGYPANYYWLYHAYLAALVKITSFSPPTVASMVNVIAIFSSFVWIGQTLKILKLGKPGTIRWGLMILLVYFSINITSVISVLGHVLNGTYSPYGFDMILLDGADERLHSVLGKVLNFTSVTLGITLFNAALYAGVKLVKLEIELATLILLSACGIAALAVREIAALHIVIALLGGMALMAALHCLRRRSVAGQARIFWRNLTGQVSPAMLLLWLAVSLALSLPLVKYNLDIVSSFQSGRPFGFPNMVNINKIVTAVLLFIPLYMLQCIFVWQNRNRDGLFLVLGAFIIASVTSVLYLPDGNQYKGIYFLAAMMAISSLLALQKLQNSGGGRRRLGGLVSAAYFVLVLSQVLYVSSSFVNRVRTFGDEGHRFDGIHIQTADDAEQRISAYYWIRDHTPPNAVVVLPLIPSIHANLYHERLMYVRMLQLHFAASALAYHERVRHLKIFYSESTGGDDYEMLIGRMTGSLPGRPIYAVVKDEEISPEIMRRRGSRLVYEHAGDGANVYWLNPEAGR